MDELPTPPPAMEWPAPPPAIEVPAPSALPDCKACLKRHGATRHPGGDPGHREYVAKQFAQIRAEQVAKRVARSPGYSTKSPQMVCPHCQTKGTVSTKSVKMKKGISGGKATGAVLTGGLSILATGLSRKENVTEANCSNCGATWTF